MEDACSCVEHQESYWYAIVPESLEFYLLCSHLQTNSPSSHYWVLVPSWVLNAIIYASDPMSEPKPISMVLQLVLYVGTFYL